MKIYMVSLLHRATINKNPSMIDCNGNQNNETKQSNRSHNDATSLHPAIQYATLHTAIRCLRRKKNKLTLVSRNVCNSLIV